MITTKKNISCIFWILIVLLASSCGNPFGTENTGSRFSPTIDDLDTSRNTISCDREVIISFIYRDPQDDILIIHLTFTGEENDGSLWDDIYWDDDSVDLESEDGRALVSYSTDCEDDYPAGDYVLRVTVEDEKGHVSNELEKNVRLF